MQLTVLPELVQSLNPKQLAILDFILAHAENDERPYLEVSVLGTTILGLLDSGATNTIIGGNGWKRLSHLKLLLNDKDKVSCTVANGEKCNSLGSVNVPFEVQGRVKIVKALVIPSLPHNLILGADFWRTMGIVPDLRHGAWKFSTSSDRFIDTVALNSQTELTPQQSKQLYNIIDSSFQKMGDNLGCTTLVEHEIKTAASPIKQRYYPVSPIMQAHIDRELEKLLSQGVVERLSSPWSSPIILVKKKDQSYRFCIDYRKLNMVTERDAYPLPYISATLDKLRDARYLSSLDIKSAYFQVPLSESSKPLTALTVPNRGLFQFCRLPMGLANSPATFQRLIDRVLGPDLEPNVFVYLDDIIVVTQTFEKHIEILIEVFERLKKANLTLSKEKCHFCRPELRYLGYVIDRNGLHVDSEKIQAILNIPTPTSVSEIRRVIGLTSWYRRFVPNFSTLIAPLSNLLRKNKTFLWDKDCENSFQSLKECLISAPVLACPDFSLPFTVQTDASGFGIGAILTQTHPEGEKVICYLSRSLTRNERNYSTTERECLAVLWAIEKLRPYIEGSKFTVITDHYSLVWLNRLQSPTGRLARWAIRLQQYDYEIIHRKGKDHIVPDTLSRSVPVIDLVSTNSGSVNDINADGQSSLPSQDKWYLKLLHNVTKYPRKFSAWRLTNDKLYKRIKPRYPELAIESDFWRAVVPRGDREKLILDTHNSSCHTGVYKTFNKLAEKYYWPKMRYDVASVIRRCKVCHSIKPEQRRPTGLMLSSQTSISRPFELLCADLVGPLPRSNSGYQYIFVVADCFSKFPLLFPLRNAKAPQIVRLLEEQVFLMFGCPRAIIVDNGVQFRSKEFVSLMKSYNVTIKYTALYHPQANPCERINKVLKCMLRSVVSANHRTWDTALAKIGCAIRSSRHEVTGLTPNFINFGREISLQGDKLDSDVTIQFDRTDINDERARGFSRIYSEVKSRLSKAYEQNKKFYDLRRRNDQFLPNELVWRRNYVLSDAAQYYTAKLAPKFLGPFIIAKRLSPWTYELKDSENKYCGVWHAKDLKAHPPDE